MSILEKCRSCDSPELSLVLDLGLQPLANNLLTTSDLGQPEPRFPLDVRVCRKCWLMQLGYTVPPVQMFSEYVYFSSFSEHMLRHAAEAATRYAREKSLGANSLVVEVASNDGYLLKNFVQQGIPCLGVEPAANVAEVARKSGVETICRFFGQKTAEDIRGQRGTADLILGNNVFAHAPDINDFVAGIRTLLAEDGWAVLEFPYGVEMLQKVEFDTIYHEHFFYLTLTPLLPLFARHGLEVFGVERLQIHGGSLRLFVGHAGRQVVRPEVAALLAQERGLGTDGLAFYARFKSAVEGVRAELCRFLEEQKAAGKTVAAYGASAKGSTLLNYLGAPARDLRFIADRSTYKQGKLSPGLHIPIVGSDELAGRRPDFALLLVWNFATEIIAQQQAYLAAGGVFVTPLPKLELTPRRDESRISLALPVYNGANYLREALESAVAQGPELAEIVVSDNVSTDGTADIIAEFVRRDPRVRHERSEVFLNQADNISRAVRLCRHEWVQMLCHDDLLRLGAIAALVKVIARVDDSDCALIGHQPCHLFADGHAYRHVDGKGRVETRADLMTASVADESADYRIRPTDAYLGEVMRKGGMPYFPAVTTAAVRRSAFEQLGGFDPRWVHFDIFLWVRLIQVHGYAESAGHWTLTRVHGEQVAVLSRKNQRSYRDFRSFYAAFLPEARERYALGAWACFKIRLKPLSQASAPLVVALHKGKLGEFFSQWFALPVWTWPLVLALTCLNFFRERRRNAELWKRVPPALTYE